MKRQDASGESQGEEYPSDEPAAVRGLVWPLSFCFGRRKEREGREKEVGDGEKGGVRLAGGNWVCQLTTDVPHPSVN